MSFRCRPGLGVPYERQGLIYFTSRTYQDQPSGSGQDRQAVPGCGGEHADAAGVLTTDADYSKSAVAVS